MPGISCVSEGINCQISVVNSTAPLTAVSKTYSATASSYVGDVLSLEGEKGSAADFNHIVATAGVTSVRVFKTLHTLFTADCDVSTDIVLPVV